MPFADLVEPPPELPLHSVLMESPRQPKKRIVNKIKGLLTPREMAPRDEFEDIPLRPPAFPLVEDSTKTFLTGNVESNSQQQRQQQQQQQQAKSNIEIPHSTILEDPGAFSNFSSSLSTRRTGLRSCVKRLNTIAQRKMETSKCNQKFLKDLVSWGQNSSFDNLDSLELVNEIQLIFQQDLIIEQNIAQRLKLLASELDFVCIREQELEQERKNLAISLKKHQYSIDKKGETHDETKILLEKVIAHERSFESYRSYYQFAISVTARNAFKELGIDLYERASDLKETTGEFLKLTLQSLENIDSNEFVKDLEKIRLVRAERNWNKLSKDKRRTDPRLWFDLVSGKRDNDDTLMQKVYKGLPKEYSPIEYKDDNNDNNNNNSSSQELRLDFPSTGLDESISAVQSGKFNPITSNEYFSPRTHERNQDNGNEKEEQEQHTADGDGFRETIFRSLNPNVVRKPTIVPTQRRNDEDSNKPAQQEDNNLNGFILNFGNISQQFDDAEKHLQENRWLD